VTWLSNCPCKAAGISTSLQHVRYTCSSLDQEQSQRHLQLPTRLNKSISPTNSFNSSTSVSDDFLRVTRVASRARRCRKTVASSSRLLVSVEWLSIDVWCRYITGASPYLQSQNTSWVIAQCNSSLGFSLINTKRRSVSFSFRHQ